MAEGPRWKRTYALQVVKSELYNRLGLDSENPYGTIPQIPDQNLWDSIVLTILFLFLFLKMWAVMGRRAKRRTDFPALSISVVGVGPKYLELVITIAVLSQNQQNVQIPDVPLAKI
jgi:hypothetical protein